MGKEKEKDQDGLDVILGLIRIHKQEESIQTVNSGAIPELLGAWHWVE
jgi:hypothetical protein